MINDNRVNYAIKENKSVLYRKLRPASYISSSEG